MMSPAAEAPAWRDPLLLLILSVSLLVNAWGIGWGLPSVHGWAMDEVLPASVLDGMRQRFSHGWHDRYPPLHFYLLATAYAPVLRVHGLSPDRPVPTEAFHPLFLVGRGLSALLAAGTLLGIYLCGRQIGTRREALLATTIAALMLPFVFYAKLANVDVPYLFWWTLSLLLLLRSLKHHRGGDLLLFAVTATLAVGTKDQAYGLYVLTVPLLLWSRSRRLGSHALVDRTVLVAAAAALLLFLAIHNVPGNADGFRAHLALITGRASQPFQDFANDPHGHLALLVQTVRHLRFTLGTPAFFVCLLGLTAALGPGRRDPLLLALLVPAVSYYLFFLSVVLYSYDRFLLPLGILAAFFGARLLEEGLGRTAWPRAVAFAALAGTAVWGLARCLSVDVLMVRDSRYAAEEWLRRNAGPDALVGAVGPPEHLPRLDDLRGRGVGGARRLQKVDPEYLVINVDYGRRAQPGTGEHDFYARLERGELGYRVVSEHGPSWAPAALLDLGALRDGNAVIRSNIGKLSPLILIFKKH